MKLYGSLASPYVSRVALLARFMKLDLPLEMPAEGLQSPAFLAKSPLGKIPCLEDGDFALPESQAICEYLEDRFPEKALRPDDLQARARSRAISHAFDVYLMAATVPILGQIDPGSRDATEVEKIVGNIKTALDQLEKLVDKSGPYLAGPAITMADCTAFTQLQLLCGFVSQAFQLGDLLAGRPTLKAWFERMMADPEVAAFHTEYVAALEAFLASMAVKS